MRLGSSHDLSPARLLALHCLRIAHAAASKSLRLCDVRPLMPYMFAGTMNAELALKIGARSEHSSG